MAIKASATITLSFMVDVKAVYRYYKLQASTASAPSVPTTATPTGWTDTEPTYTEGSTNTLYTVDKTVFTNDTFLYSAVSKSTSYEAAKAAYNKAVAAQNSANDAKDTIDNLQIGGKNLASSSKIGSCITTLSKNGYEYTQMVGNSAGIKFPSSMFEVDVSYVLSFKFQKLSTDVPLTYMGGYASSFTTKKVVINGDSITGRSWSTGCAIADSSEVQTCEVYLIYKGNTNDNALYIQPQRGSGYHSSADISIKYWDIQIEKGDKATDWTPAPEDVESAIDKAQNTANNASKTATDYMKFQEGTGLIVGDHTASTLGKNTLIDANGMAVRDGSTELARFGSNEVELGKNNADTTISMRNGGLKISNYNRGGDYTQIGCYGNLDISACTNLSTENFKRGGITSTIEANDRAEWQHFMNKKWSDISTYSWEDLNTSVFASELGTYFETRIYADNTDQSTANGFNTSRIYLRTATKPADNRISSEIGMLGDTMRFVYKNAYMVDVYDGDEYLHTPIKFWPGGDGVFGAFRFAGNYGTRNWLGFYSTNSDALSNLNRKAWIGHDGSTNFNIQNQAGGNNYVNKAWTVSSDKRLKEDIEAIPEVFVDIWKEIEPKIFRWNELNYDIEQKYQFGIIAQDATAAFEKYGLDYRDYNLVNVFELDGIEYFNVTYEHYNMITSLALKSAMNRLDDLESRISKIEAALSAEKYVEEEGVLENEK